MSVCIAILKRRSPVNLFRHFLEEFLKRQIHGGVGPLGRGWLGNHVDVEVAFQQMPVPTEILTHQAFDPVALNSPADPAADSHPQPPPACKTRRHQGQKKLAVHLPAGFR